VFNKYWPFRKQKIKNIVNKTNNSEVERIDEAQKST
jgi:hypothetical protein